MVGTDYNTGYECMFIQCGVVGTDYNTLEFFIMIMNACFFCVTWLVLIITL
jgi:hypothetical protein